MVIARAVLHKPSATDLFQLIEKVGHDAELVLRQATVLYASRIAGSRADALA